LYIELKEIDKDTLKVGDVVGVMRTVQAGWRCGFRHALITPAKIIRITPKRTKFVTDKFGDHDRYEAFYECNFNAEKENELAEKFVQLKESLWDIEIFQKGGLTRISDEDLPEVAEHMEAMMKILEKYRKE
jgi:hypothetical protein